MPDSRLRRPIGELPADSALRALLEARKAASPGVDPLTSPPLIEAPQALHASARTRFAQDSRYRPANLAAALEREQRNTEAQPRPA